MGADDNATLEKWTVTAQDYKEINGLMIPVKGEVTWNLANGDFTWAKLTWAKLEITTSSTTFLTAIDEGTVGL